MLSIIIPVYNGEKYINECLNSIIKEIKNKKEIQIIIINDGSSDKTKEIIEAIEYENLKIYNNENKGVAYSRNFAIEQADGEYIMFVDADDILMNNWYRDILDVIKIMKLDVIYYNSKIKKTNKEMMIKYVFGNNNEHICIAGPVSKIYKKDFINQNKIRFKEELINGEDMIFNFEVLLKSNNYIVINKDYYMYRQALGTSTKRFNPKFFESDKKFHSYLKKIIDENNMNNNELIEFCRMGGLYSTIDRVGYTSNFYEFKKYIKEIDRKFYLEDLNYEYLNNKLKKIIVKFYVKKMYILLFFVEKAKIIYMKSKEKNRDIFKKG